MFRFSIWDLFAVDAHFRRSAVHFDEWFTQNISNERKLNETDPLLIYACVMEKQNSNHQILYCFWWLMTDDIIMRRQWSFYFCFHFIDYKIPLNYSNENCSLYWFLFECCYVQYSRAGSMPSKTVIFSLNAWQFNK